VIVQIKRLDSALPLPAYAYPGDAGLDLTSAIDIEIVPHQRALVPTGIQIAIPEGYAGFVLPRSGLAAKTGLSLVNAPGLIDSHYRGEIVCIAINHDHQQPIMIKRGDRVAQLVILPTPLVTLREVDELDATQRGDQGFGSSGV
jgi:dUTP pyrophosphatase